MTPRLSAKTAKQVAVLLFVVLAVWWFALSFVSNDEANTHNLAWAASYQIMALWGGILGLMISKYWGGTKSIMGRAVMLLSIGLLLQVFGQSVFSYYNIVLKVDVPYPSIADIGFFVSIPAYIWGVVLLARASGATLSLKSFGRKIQALVIPIVLLVVSYYFFLRSYEFDFSAPLNIFLDFGYPLGQAIYVSLAIMTFILSRQVLGGVMRKKIMLVLAALVVQYVADYNFLFQAYRSTWVNGGYGDLIYLIAYFITTLSLLNLSQEFLGTNLETKST